MGNTRSKHRSVQVAEFPVRDEHRSQISSQLAKQDVRTLTEKVC
jgi:hypothetical protein